MSSTNCSIKVSEYFSVGINGVCHVLILFTFLTILYFVIVAPLSDAAFQKTIKTEVGGAVHKMTKDISDTDRYYISRVIHQDIGGGKSAIDTAISHYSKPTDVIVENNKWIKITAIEIILVIALCMLIVILILRYSCNKCTGIFDIVKENAITFLFVGIVEYTFFTFIAFKYIPSPPSTMLTIMIDAFKKVFV